MDYKFEILKLANRGVKKQMAELEKMIEKGLLMHIELDKAQRLNGVICYKIDKILNKKEKI